MQDSVEMLEKHLFDLTNHLKVNNTRLEHRAWRPNVELCRDEPKHGLVSEYHVITGDISAVKRRLSDARYALDRLVNRRWELEQEINVKTFTLFIDKDQCGKLRRQVDWRPFIQRHPDAILSLPYRSSSRETASPMRRPIYSPKKLSMSEDMIKY